MVGRFLSFAAGIVATSVLSAAAADTSQIRKIELIGRSFEYTVAGYHLCLTFTGEDKLRWVYLAAPGGETGKTAEESFDRRDIRSDVVMLAWTEASGANITDLFDFGEMMLHASFVTADGQRFFSDASISERIDCEAD